MGWSPEAVTRVLVVVEKAIEDRETRLHHQELHRA